MKAQYTIQCTHPETGRQGCWIFRGDTHRAAGTSLSPFFPDLLDLFRWFRLNGWELSSHAPTGCIQKPSTLDQTV